MEKTYFFHSVIVPANNIVTVECFINEGYTTRRPVILLCVIEVVVQFYPWFNLDFSLFFSMLIYDNEYKTKDNQTEPRIKLNYNICT